MDLTSQNFLDNNIWIFWVEGLGKVIEVLNQQFLKWQKANFGIVESWTDAWIYLDIENRERIIFLSFHDLENYLIQEFSKAHIAASESLLQDWIISEIWNLNTIQKDIHKFMSALISIAYNNINAWRDKLAEICKIYSRETDEILSQKRVDSIAPAKLRLYDEGDIIEAERHFWEANINVLYKLISTSDEAIDLKKLCQQTLASILTFINEKWYEFTLYALKKTKDWFESNIADRDYWGSSLYDWYNLEKYVT